MSRIVKLRRKLYRRAMLLVPYRYRHSLEYLRVYKRRPARNGAMHSERMLDRSTGDSSPLLTDMCSKVKMKEMARQRLGTTAIRIPETYWFGSEEDVQSALTRIPKGDWVLKPNNLGGGVAHFIHVKNAAPEVPEKFFEESAEQDLAFRVLAPLAWKGSKAGYLIEEKIGDHGETLCDYKIHMFAGVPRVLSVYNDRDTVLSVAHFYLPDAESIAFSRGPNPPLSSGLSKGQLKDLCQAAKELSPKMEYLRIDFYVRDGVIWFGEYSPFGGIEGISARPHIDQELGSWWTSTKGSSSNA